MRRKREETNRSRLFTRRALVLGAGKLGLLTLLGGRLYYLQVVEQGRFQTLAEDNRINLRLLAPPRGLIVDRAGVPLAVNRPNYRAMLVAEQVTDVQGALDTLEQIVPLKEHEIQRILGEVESKRAFVPVTVREKLTWAQVARLEANAPDLPGISIDVGELRFYPQGAAMSSVLGYVASVSEREQGDDPLLQLPGFRIGKSGIEKQYDKVMRGAAGSSHVEVNASGRVLRELSRDPGVPGEQIQLTIDSGLQKVVYERLQEEVSASAVIMDIYKGDILALASWPGYDPNMFARGLTTEEWKTLVSDPLSPLTNKAVAGAYAPGSTFKPCVALAAMEAGVSPQHRVHCSGVVRVGRTLFHCWKRGGHGWNNMYGGIQHSCNVYFYDVARRAGIDRIAEMAHRLGLGQPTGIDLPNENPGVIPNRAWKQAVFGEPWQGGETLVAGVGQGFIQTTPLQLTVMAARIANGGLAVKPRLLKARGDDIMPAAEPQIAEAGKAQDATDSTALGALVSNAQAQEGLPEPLGIPAEHIAVVHKAMDMVVNELGGTAYRSRIVEEGFEMAGKTGTSQVNRITMAERRAGLKKNDELPWRQRDHAVFICFAPVHRPRYACAVVVEHGGGGSRAAAPIARDIMLECEDRSPADLLAPVDLSAVPGAKDPA
jgi:penicillin-binding protein 2